MQLFVLPPDLKVGDEVLMIEDPENGLKWSPGVKTAYYTVATTPVRKLLEPTHPTMTRPALFTWWTSVVRDASPDDPRVWSDGVMDQGKIVRRAFFIEDHQIHARRAGWDDDEAPSEPLGTVTQVRAHRCTP